MVNTNFSQETAQSVMVMYEQRIEALLSNIELLEMQLDYALKQNDL
tara:strand:- start:355 stop:492 length:138 start_codon:yes stop_codon:yes gene_type:complete